MPAESLAKDAKSAKEKSFIYKKTLRALRLCEKLFITAAIRNYKNETMSHL